MSDPLTIHCFLEVPRQRAGKASQPAEAPSVGDAGRVPRVARLLALAHRLEGLLREGVVRDYAALAQLGHVSRARLSQIVSLLLLAPDIQEEILFLSSVARHRSPLHLAQLRPIAAEPDWVFQRRRWHALKRSLSL